MLMNIFFKKFLSYNPADTFRALAENEKDNLNREIIALKQRLEETYKRRDYLNDKLGYM